jgi:hypothetical protein
LRDELGFVAGQEVDLRATNGALEVEVEVAAAPMRLESCHGNLVATTDREIPALPPDCVRETLEQIRR